MIFKIRYFAFCFIIISGLIFAGYAKNIIIKGIWSAKGHYDQIISVDFNYNNEIVATGSDVRDKTVKLWDSKNGKLLKTIETDANWHVAFHPKKNILVSSGNNTIVIWDVDGSKIINKIDDKIFSVRTLAFSPDGKYFATGDLSNVIKLWDGDTGNFIKEFKTGGGDCFTLDFSPDGKYVSGGGNPDFYIWDISTGNIVHTLKTYTEDMRYDANIDTFSVAFSPDTKMLASGGADHKIRLWDVTTGLLLKVYKVPPARINKVEFSPDGKILVFGTYKILGVLNVSTGQISEIKNAHKGAVTDLDFSSDGKFFATGAKDKILKMWRVLP
ncbi:MAG: hypothetical protein CVV44_10340 [Spirochaetae bacterium HGW-Spirochaetae-1]|jgi:WD40 repeat protein|nr:MAG: hypothetical protein CVV44_10340 [Spirochaetae bacterium HGW-Spirochaetae-1]